MAGRKGINKTRAGFYLSLDLVEALHYAALALPPVGMGPDFSCRKMNGLVEAALRHYLKERCKDPRTWTYLDALTDAGKDGGGRNVSNEMRSHLARLGIYDPNIHGAISE